MKKDDEKLKDETTETPEGEAAKAEETKENKAPETPEQKEVFDEGLNGNFEGIGAELTKEGPFIVVVSPIKGSPAFRAGLKPRDIIVKIDDQSATDIPLTEAVNRIRGPKGEKVVLRIVRDGQEKEIPIIRDNITIPSVDWEMRDKVAVISVSRFGPDTTAAFVEAARTVVNSQKAEAIVLDLRGNPGGLLDSAVDISSCWLEEGKTVLLEKRNQEIVKTYKSDGREILKGLPTVVLIDEGSASASEIVAGALHDNGVATLIGQKSFGKGSIQRLADLSDGGSLKVTFARWFTPKDKNIDKQGIKPDIEVKLSSEDIKAKRDPQLQQAINHLKSKL